MNETDRQCSGCYYSQSLCTKDEPCVYCERNMLKDLVREMEKVVGPVARGLDVASGVVYVNGTYADIAQKIINRPQVKAIMEKQP